MVTACLLYLTLRMTVTTAQRSFSKLNLINTFLRSTICHVRIRSLAILSMRANTWMTSTLTKLLLLLLITKTARTLSTIEHRDGNREYNSNCITKATPTTVGEAFIFYLWTFFLPRTDIAARRRSVAPSKVYQWLGDLGPTCRQKVTRKNFANRPLIFTRGQSAKFGVDSQNRSPLTGCSFETEQHIGNLKHVSGAQMIALNIDLEIWPTLPLIFTQAVKKCKNCPLRHCGFETKQHITCWNEVEIYMRFTVLGVQFPTFLVIFDLLLGQKYTSSFDESSLLEGQYTPIQRMKIWQKSPH